MSVSICVAISNESKHICNKAPVVMRCCTAFWYRSDSRSWSNQIAFKFMEMLKCIWPIDLIKKKLPFESCKQLKRCERGKYLIVYVCLLYSSIETESLEASKSSTPHN